VLSLPVLGVVAIVILNPTAAWLILGWLAANHHPPSFLQGQFSEADFRDPKGASQKVTATLRQRFPVGTSEAAFKADLLRQGFKPMTPPPADCLPKGQRAPVGVIFTPCYDASNTLIYSWSAGIACGDRVTVKWQADQSGNIVQIEGSYLSVCL
jgi:hypothetical protein